MFFKKNNLANDEREKKELIHIQECFKKLRANIMFSLAGNKDKAKIILVTSAEAGDGKSTTCLNIASSFADSGAKVLVVDADLRRSKDDIYLGVAKKAQGLSDFLGGFCALEDVIIKDKSLNFDCIFSGRTPPNPSELLMIDEVEEMFEKLSEEYDYIFMDTPPVGVVAETIHLTQYVSGIILIVKKGSSHMSAVKEAVKLLNFAKANILGFVINDAYGDTLNSKKGYYYKRSYYHYK